MILRRLALVLGVPLLIGYGASNAFGDDTAVHPGDPVKFNEHMDAMNLVKESDATEQTVQSGVWSDPRIWSKKHVPQANDRVLIGQGHTITVDGVEPNRVYTIGVQGTLRFLPTANTELDVATLVVEPSGILRIGTAQQPIAAGKTACLKFVLPQSIHEVDPRWDPERLSGGLISHGTVSVFGEQKTAFVRSSGGQTGDTTLTLWEPVRNWKVGDSLLIPGVNPTHPEDEVRIIASLSADGRTVVLDRGLDFPHKPPRADLFLDVADLTRNVILESDLMTADDINRRGHVMFMHNPHVTVEYAAFQEIGRTDKGVLADDHIVDAKGGLIVNPKPPLNPRGRYAVHFHRTGSDPRSSPAIVTGCVVMHSPGWGFVNHGSYVIFTDNVAYDVKGAAFVTERGDEVGSFLHNLAVRDDGISKPGGNRRPDGANDVLIFTDHGNPVTEAHDNVSDFGYGGNGFWLQGGAVLMKGNSAYGFTDGGFVSYGRGIATVLEEANGTGRIGYLPQRNLLTADGKSDQKCSITEIPLRWFDNTAIGGGVAVHVLDNHPNDPKLPTEMWSKFFGFIAWNIYSPIPGNDTLFDLRYSGDFVLSDVTALAGDYGKMAGLIGGDTGGPAGLLLQHFDVEGFDKVTFLKGPWYLLDGYFDNRSVVATSDSDHAVLQDVLFGNTLGLSKECDFTIKRESDVFRSLTLLWNQMINGVPVQKQLFMSAQKPDAVFHGGGYPADYQGLTNTELKSRFGVIIGAAFAPADAAPMTHYHFPELLVGTPFQPSPFLTSVPRQEIGPPLTLPKRPATQTATR